VNQSAFDQARRRVRAVYSLAEKLDRYLDDFQRRLGGASQGELARDSGERSRESVARISKDMDEVCRVLEESCRFLAGALQPQLRCQF
jgi:hypothetical protein